MVASNIRSGNGALLNGAGQSPVSYRIRMSHDEDDFLSTGTLWGDPQFLNKTTVERKPVALVLDDGRCILGYLSTCDGAGKVHFESCLHP